MFGLNREDALGLQEDLHLLNSNRQAAEATDSRIRQERGQTDMLMGVAIKLKLKDNAIMQERAKLEQALRENQALQKTSEENRVSRNGCMFAVNAERLVLRKLATELAELKGTRSEDELARISRMCSRQFDEEALEGMRNGIVPRNLKETAAQEFRWYVPE